MKRSRGLETAHPGKRQECCVAGPGSVVSAVPGGITGCQLQLRESQGLSSLS